jgi:hypothetical protein
MDVGSASATFDVEGYAANYDGIIKIQRLMVLADVLLREGEGGVALAGMSLTC